MDHIVPGKYAIYEMVHLLNDLFIPWSIVYTGDMFRGEDQKLSRDVPPWHLPIHPSRWFTFKRVINFYIVWHFQNVILTRTDATHIAHTNWNALKIIGGSILNVCTHHFSKKVLS